MMLACHAARRNGGGPGAGRTAATPFPSRLCLRATAAIGAALCLALAPAGRLASEDWPQFRGPNSTGISTSAKPLPVRFSETENVVWSADVGDGIGSPVVAAGRVFTAGMVGEERVALYCFDAATGRELWRRELETGSLPEIHHTNSHASTTPAADAERVYFYFTTLGLRAFDARTGADAWHCELPVPFFIFKWGAGMSPVLHGDLVIFCQDDDLNPALYGIDRETGRIVWTDDRSDMAVNYSHPVVCETERGPEIVVAGTGKLIGYDPATGERLWHARVLLRNIKTTPVVQDGVIYVSLESGGIANQWLASADANKDGRLTKEEIQAFVGEDVEIPQVFWDKFDRGDTDGDGALVGAELDRAFLDPDNFAGARFDAENPSEQYILAVRGGGRGDVTESHVLWRHASRAPDHIVSPLVLDGRMLLVKGGGIANCFDVERGETLWPQRRIQNTCDYFASPVAGDGKIYIAGENGVVVVLENAPQLNILSLNDLGESILGTPAISDGRLYFRTRTKLLGVAETP